MFGFWSKKREKLPDSSMAAVVSGDMIPIEETKDAVFSQKMLGDGIAILPKSEWIVAPCDGTVSMVYPTLHALGIINEDGLEILIHIGIDTVALNGEGFQCYVRQGQKVKTGDKLIRFDKKVMEKKKADLTTMMIFPGCRFDLDLVKRGSAEGGKTIVATYKKTMDEERKGIGQ